MLRDQTERTVDMEALDKISMEDLNYDTIHGYRNIHRSLKEGHSFERLSDHEYLRSIGAAAISEEDGKLHPTAAGMLMFGDEYNIVGHFPEHFLDYREELDPATRWSDRLQSSSGEWSGNVCDFYFRIYNKIIKDGKVPFNMLGGERIDDTPVHKALREALANCLINADYNGLRGVVIKKEPDKLILANPGYVRTGKMQMRIGGKSVP
jgi:ATP-dependent DNA helicase RecG